MDVRAVLEQLSTATRTRWMSGILRHPIRLNFRTPNHGLSKRSWLLRRQGSASSVHARFTRRILSGDTNLIQPWLAGKPAHAEAGGQAAKLVNGSSANPAQLITPP
jgi:hypothetical protein